MIDLLRGVGSRIDFRLNVRGEYEARVASRGKVLDVGGRNESSDSGKKITLARQHPEARMFSTDILFRHRPDVVDDICRSSIKAQTFDGVFCQAVLEHVEEYGKAVDNIYEILKKDGELFIYVPFIFHFHDEVDYHRFSFVELDRMLRRFSTVRIFVPEEESGIGWVWWYVATFTGIGKYKRLHRLLAKMTNTVFKLMLHVIYQTTKRIIREKFGEMSFKEFNFFYTYLFMNHGFCAWAKK